jgi:hypothetical protein
MKPGKELDLLVAEKVMGFVGDYHPDVVPVYPPQYSTDIAAAWQIVEKINMYFKLEKGSNLYQAEFGKCDWVASTSAPYAICVAALQAKGVEA